MNGEPIFGPGAKSIKIQFVNPPMGDFGADKKTIDFKLDKMTLRWQTGLLRDWQWHVVLSGGQPTHAKGGPRPH